MSNSQDSAGPKCSRCRQPVKGMTAVTIVASLEKAPDHLCARCAADDHAKSLSSIEEADRFIDEATRVLADLEKFIAECPEMPDIPQGLEGAMTPVTVYRTLQLHLAAFKSRRMELLTEVDSQARVEYAIKKAIEAEDYELALELKRRHAERPTEKEKD